MAENRFGNFLAQAKKMSKDPLKLEMKKCKEKSDNRGPDWAENNTKLHILEAELASRLAVISTLPASGPSR